MYFAPDADESLNRRKLDRIAGIGQACREHDLRFLLEPLVYDPGLQPGTSAFAAAKPNLVRRATAAFADDSLCADVLKVEVPVDLDFVEGFGVPQMTRAEALEAMVACCNAAGGRDVVYLSAGVPFERFEASLLMAGEAGVKLAGFMCGRALWSDAVGIFGAGGEEALRAWLRDTGSPAPGSPDCRPGLADGRRRQHNGRATTCGMPAAASVIRASSGDSVRSGRAYRCIALDLVPARVGNGQPLNAKAIVEDLMRNSIKVGLIRGSLPSYFPERHNVWERAQTALETLCDRTGADLLVVPEIPMNATETRARRWTGAGRKGSISCYCSTGDSLWGMLREPWPRRRSVPVSGRCRNRCAPATCNSTILFPSTCPCQLPALVRELTVTPVQWYHGAPESPALLARLGTTIRSLAALKDLEGASIGVIGGLAMTFYNMEISTNLLRSRLGVEFAHHDMHEMTARMESQERGRVEDELNALRNAAVVEGISDAQLELTARAVLGIARHGRWVRSRGACRQRLAGPAGRSRYASRRRLFDA